MKIISTNELKEKIKNKSINTICEVTEKPFQNVGKSRLNQTFDMRVDCKNRHHCRRINLRREKEEIA